MTKTLKVGDRFSSSYPGTVVAVLGGEGAVSGYEVKLDGAPDGETWLVPLEELGIIPTDGTHPDLPCPGPL